MTDFGAMQIEETLSESDKESGLTQREVEISLAQDGYNEVPDRKKSAVGIFLKRFWGLNARLLEFIILVSFLLHNYNDVYLVTTLLFLNAILGFMQENQASKSVDALKKKLQVNSRVLRDGQWINVPARELVRGDMIRLRPGDFVPADTKIVRGNLWMDQSAITGESQEVEKNPGDILYSGSIVTRSEATGIVTLTGSRTYYGRTVSLVQIAKPKLHIEKSIAEIIRVLLIVIVVMLTIATIFSYLRGINLLQLLPLFLVLLLTVVPVALPTMFIVTLAIGSNKLVKKNVLITRLNALDDEASADILCANKTGTLTLNRLSVTQTMSLGAFGDSDVLLFGALASDEANKDPVDIAFVDAARTRNLLPSAFQVKKFIPFDPANRMTEAILQDTNGEARVMKGAFATIAELCKLGEGETKRLEAKVNDFAAAGCKTIAVAMSKGQKKSMVGLAALQDVPRGDSGAVIRELNDLGVSVKMLTGDALPIAKEISRQVGLGQNILRAFELKDLVQKSPQEATALAERADGFAEIYPEDKYMIIRSLQAGKHVVGMTGDGVNDAVALKQAEVGIATHNATDVAKGVSSIVLTKEGLSGIIEPIKVGRMMFQTMNTWILQKIVWTVLMTSLVVVSLFFTGRFVLSSSAALYMLLLTDFGKISLSTDNARWSNNPEKRRIKDLAKVGIILALIILAEALAILYLGHMFLGVFSDDQSLSTFTFEILFTFATFTIIVVRERGHFWDSMPSKFLSAALTIDSVAAIILATIGIPGLKAIPLAQTVFVFSLTLASTLIINDRAKIFLLKRMALTNVEPLGT